MTDEPIEIDVEELDARLKSGEAVQVVDVREPWELDIARLAGTIDIPMSTLPKGLCNIDQEKPLAVICHHGGRSLQVARWLRQQGYARAQSVRGGLDVWSQAIDPNIPRY